MRLSALDRKILNCIQQDMPLSQEPFKILAGRLGLETEKFIERVKELKKEGFIRTFSAGLNHRKLNFKSTLLALKVPADRIESLAKRIINYPEVTHCYLRDGEYNLWVVFICLKKKKMDLFLKKLKAELGNGNILNLTTKKQFKLETRLKI